MSTFSRIAKTRLYTRTYHKATEPYITYNVIKPAYIIGGYLNVLYCNTFLIYTLQRTLFLYNKDSNINTFYQKQSLINTLRQSHPQPSDKTDVK